MDWCRIFRAHQSLVPAQFEPDVVNEANELIELRSWLWRICRAASKFFSYTGGMKSPVYRLAESQIYISNDEHDYCEGRAVDTAAAQR